MIFPQIFWGQVKAAEGFEQYQHEALLMTMAWY